MKNSTVPGIINGNFMLGLPLLPQYRRCWMSNLVASQRRPYDEGGLPGGSMVL